MKKALFLLMFVFAGFITQAQIFITKTGKVSFHSSTPLENIDAVNNEVNSLMNTANGEIVFSLLMKSFRFERALMEEHFNENYVESTKFPKATFKGNIENLKDVNFDKDGSYKVKVKGTMTIHGVSREEKADGVITVKGGKIIVTSTFNVKPADYGIKIPSLVAGKIKENIEVRVNCVYDPKK